MVTRTKTLALQGIETTPVDVEVMISSGLASFNIVGLPDNAVKESKERVRATLSALGISLPAKRITVNLSPADVLKSGSHYDLPIAAALLVALGAMPSDSLENSLFMGELSLDGRLNAVKGALPGAICAQAIGMESVFVPSINAPEAAWAGDVDVFGLATIKDLIAHTKGDEVLTPARPGKADDLPAEILDFADIKGQDMAKTAAEMAAAGGHNLALAGPPGAGKSMTAKRITGLLPPLSSQEALEVSLIHSVADGLQKGLITQRPFRSPHHSASAVALCGGGHNAKPGEVSLAHRGVLFLDELPEFASKVLETLRQPVEDGVITISRANHHVTYPARFQLVAAMNPCKCGYLGDPARACSQAPLCSEKYLSKISGPLLDRFDLKVSVPAVEISHLQSTKTSEDTATIRERVLKARDMQYRRFNGKIECNADMSTKMTEEVVQPDSEGQKILSQAAEKFKLSARGYYRTLKVARTVADLRGDKNVSRPHIAQALGFRQF